MGEGGGVSQVSGAEYVRDEEEKRVGVGSERNLKHSLNHKRPALEIVNSEEDHYEIETILMA